MNKHLTQHGDGVRDVAFSVDDATAIYDYSVKNGATSVHPPQKIEDSNGYIIFSTIKTYGDTTHTFIERKHYKGIFLPGYVPHYHK